MTGVQTCALPISGAAPSGEQLDLVGDARTGRIDQPHHRDLVTKRCLGQPHDLLDGARSPAAGLDRGVVGHDGDGSAVDLAHSGDDAVGGQRRAHVVAVRGVRQELVFDERTRVAQQIDAVPDEQLVLRRQLVGAGVQTNGEIGRASCRERVSSVV